MPLNFSAAHSSRITKRTARQNALPKRSWSSPFMDLKQRKPLRRSVSKPEVVDDGDDSDDNFGDSLEDLGIVKTLASDVSLRDVAQTIQYIQSHMFDAMPEGGGFNSTRIAETLNFRRSLPPTVTVAHVHALIDSPTKTQREIAELTKAGTIRELVIPGRGTAGSSVGEGLVLLSEIERLVKDAKELDQGLSDRFLEHIRSRPTAQVVPLSGFSGPEITTLMRAGFLTSSTPHTNAADFCSFPDSASRGTATSISSISRAASGSMAAVGGEDAIHGAGGRGGIRRSTSQFQSAEAGEDAICEEQSLRVSLPGTGPYLKLLIAARSHLISLIIKSKYRELPLYLLVERWNGGISADDPAAKAKRYRGEFSGILPSRTRKWKQFYGLSFDWVLAECLGAGLVEVFETGSVGRAARIP